MAKHAVSPDIPVSDSERLIQASQILKACIVANDTSHSFDIDHSYPLEAVHSLVQDVIGHRGQRKPKRPGEAPTSITGRLMQAASVLELCIIANDTDPDFDKGFDFSPPMHLVAALLDEANERLHDEDDKKFVRRNPKLMREAELMRTPTAGPTSPIEGKPN